ncbi:RTX toxin and related Ca2+-binding protein [Actinokineospora spheciospongiae]|uniref:RTX toxin and related Ca2+-binding protein n=1 Tax=Actinokineospora spheciospongiae TaxID=909613 RepID=W7J2K5_9PSEU|nr:hypothetical protein [Actinokineospora spheciospongiae]EWC63171.1 RTX toxin and related Ca2+-binding protein [Actinokineospora spheciospongiae]
MNKTIPVLAAALLTAALTTHTAAAAGTTPADITWATANSVSTGNQHNAAVSAVRNGWTAVAWEDDRDGGDALHSEVFLRLFKDGVSRYETKLSAGGTGNWTHLQPDVALHDDGSAVVVWATDGDGNGYYNIAVRAVRTDGTVSGSATANASSDGQQLDPAVAADPDSAGFAVVWEDEQTATAPTVRVAGFASVTSKTYEAQVHAAGGTHQRPDVAVGAAGNAVVVWDEDGDANGSFNVGLKVLTPAGGVKRAQGVANATTAGQQRHPSVAANFAGDFAVAWETDHTGTAATAVRSFTAAGAAGAETVLAGADPQVGIDDQRGVAVAWSTGQDVFAQGLNADGTATGRLPRLAAVKTATGRQEHPALGVDAWGQLTVAYTDDNDGNGADQVYLGTGLLNSTW